MGEDITHSVKDFTMKCIARCPGVKGKSVAVIWTLSNTFLRDRRGAIHITKPKTTTELRAKGVYFKQPAPAPNALHPISTRYRDPSEIKKLVWEMVECKQKLEQAGYGVIVVGPLVRYPKPCCDISGHLPDGFTPEDYLYRVYQLAFFMLAINELKDVPVIHPGEIFGWGEDAKPDRILSKEILETDGVHLTAPYAAKLDSIIEDIARKLTNQESLGSRVGRRGGISYKEYDLFLEDLKGTEDSVLVEPKNPPQQGDSPHPPSNPRAQLDDE
jgi:hypothetical protein